MDENRTSQRESFPKFNLVAANAAMDRMPAAVCVFELRERMVGQAFIADVGDESVILHYSFTPEYAESCKCQIEIKTIELKHKDRSL